MTLLCPSCGQQTPALCLYRCLPACRHAPTPGILSDEACALSLQGSSSSSYEGTTSSSLKHMRAACTHTKSTTTACPRCGSVPCCEPARPVPSAGSSQPCLAAAVSSMTQQSLQAPVQLLPASMHCTVWLVRMAPAAVQPQVPLCCRCTKAFYERRRLPKYMQDQPRKDPLAAAEATQVQDKTAPSSSSGKPPSGRRNAMVSIAPSRLCSSLLGELPATPLCLLPKGRLLPPALSSTLAEG